MSMFPFAKSSLAFAKPRYPLSIVPFSPLFRAFPLRSASSSSRPMRNGDSPSHSPIAPLRRKRRDGAGRPAPATRRESKSQRRRPGPVSVVVVRRLPCAPPPAGRLLTDGEILIVLPPKKNPALGPVFRRRAQEHERRE